MLLALMQVSKASVLFRSLLGKRFTEEELFYSSWDDVPPRVRAELRRWQEGLQSMEVGLRLRAVVAQAALPGALCDGGGGDGGGVCVGVATVLQRWRRGGRAWKRPMAPPLASPAASRVPMPLPQLRSAPLAAH